MLFGFKVRSAPSDEVKPPARKASQAALSTTESMAIPASFRAMQILATSASQLAIDVERGDVRIEAPSLIRKPCLTLTRADWVEQCVLSLAATGNAFIRKVRVGADIVDLPLLPANEVHVGEDEHGVVHYDWRGKRYYADEITHVGLLKLPGQLRALGPIQAARAGLTFTRDLRDYMSRWWDDTGQATGVLTSDQNLTSDDARTYRRAWNGLNSDGSRISDADNPTRIKVLGKGLKYEPTLLSPEDALWLEAQNWNLREAAVVFGMPTTLMLVGYEGASRTYTNADQEWLAYVRFTLMWYLGKIEDALSDCLVRGQDARFRIESLLRSDTKSRYEAHQIAVNAGWRTPAEVRRIEGEAPHPAIPDEPRPAMPTTTPAAEEPADA